MTTLPRILVVAATGRELASGTSWQGLICGVGPVEAAVKTAMGIAEHRPHAVLHVGIAGARRHLGLVAGTLVVGSLSRYTDLGELPASWATREIAAPQALGAAIRRVAPAALQLPIGTSARVGGTLHEGIPTACAIEAMEGFGVLRAAQCAGVPAIEVRAVSNDIEEADRTKWHFDVAFRTITDITPIIVSAMHEALAAADTHA